MARHLKNETDAESFAEWLEESPPIVFDVTRFNRSTYLYFKRALDLVLTTIVLLLLSPLLLSIALLIKLDSRGPVIFVQKRAGFDPRTRRRRIFTLYKFRSMTHNCDQSVHRQLVHNWVGRERGERVQTEDASPTGLVKIVNDSRITSFGGYLRRTSLDELPQLWNVLHGDMSLVGPRPVPLYEVQEYLPWQRLRLDATPGITGLWQVKGRGRVSFDEMVRMDLEYIRSQSLWVDLWILLKTIPAVVSGRGAV